MVVKKIWRARPDNPAGTPYSLLATIDVADGTTNRDGAAIPSPNLSLPKTSSRLIPNQITDEPYNVGDAVGAGMSIKSMGGNVG
jgi:hypothetical protein